MKHFLLSFSVGVSLLTAVSVQAQNLTAQNLNQLNYSAQQLVQQLVGTGVTVSNVTISGGGSRNCMGLFQANGAAGPNFVGFQQGVMLATGTIGQTPLTESGNNQGGASVNGSNLSDANLETEIGANSGDTKDAVFLEFDFIPLSDTIRVSYCFASEEYNEYVCSGFNDAFAFLISGPGIAGLKNIALVPNTTQRVAINTINNGSCGSASLATTCNGTNQPCNLGNTAYYKGTPNNGPMQFDGHTIKMEAKRKVQPCQTYHIKLVIADLSDRAYDSAVFLEAQSFTTGVLDVAVNGNSGNNNMSEGCDPATITFTLEDPAPAGGYTVPITFGGTATQGTDYTYTPSPIKIPAGQTSVTVTINPLTDAVNDAGETVTMNVQTSVCGTEQFIVTIREPLAAPNVTCSTTSNSIIFSWNNVNGATSYQVSNTSANGPWGNPNGTNQHTISGLPNGACRTLWVRAVGGYCSTNPSGTTSCCINNCTLTTTATGVSPLCNGASNGTATANPSGGSAAYTYSWSTSPTSTGQTASGLAAGVYTVTVTSGGCSATATVSLTNPPVLNASITTTQTINCFNGTNGAISVTASGGTTPYTYSIDNGANQSGNTFSGLGSGNHTVTVTDSKGCTKTASVNLANPADLTASASVTTQPTCSVGGTVSVTAGGGTSPYTYSWSSGATTATASGLNPGGYTVTVTDSKGCTETASVTLATPGGISASASLVNGVSCFGGSDGQVSVSVSGGTTPYTYTPSGGSAQSSNVFTGLSAGTFTVTVQDVNGCSVTTSVTVTQPSQLNASITTTQTINCFNGTNGAISVTASGGTTPYTYSIDNGANQSGNTFSGLGSGNHTVTVTDSKGCTKTASVNLANPADLTASASVTTQPTCSVGGTVSVTAGGGTSPYTYSWSSGATTATASGLNPGGYTVTVTDSKGCTETASVTLAAPGGISASASLVNGVSCFGGNDGQVSVSVSGGTTPYTYTPSGGSAQSSNVFTGLSAGTFTVTVQDVNGCSVTTSVTITQPSQLNASITTTQTINCFNGTNGAISVTASGGTTPYTYSIDNGANQSGNTFSGLGSGNHTVTVTDSKGCTKTASVNLANPADLTASASVTTQPTCSVGGTVSVTAGGGTSPYTYSWSSGATTATASGLNPGGYTVTVTDSKGCTETASVTLAVPGGISASTSLVNGVSCFGGSDGQVSVSVSGGTTPYTYTPSGGSAQSSNVFTGLSAGTFTVTVQDVNGCSVTTSVTITQPSQLNVSLSSTAISCGGDNSGQIVVTATGGTQPYTYSIGGTEQSSPIFPNLFAGNYYVTVKDANGCLINRNLLINQPAPLTININSINPKCNALNDGSIIIAVTGGVPPYSFSMNGSTPQLINFFDNLSAGTYNLTVSDANGCSITASTTLTEPTPLTLSLTGTNISCNGGTDGTVSTVSGGGTGAYTYTWSNAQTTANLTNVAAGTYDLTVSDANGCSITASTTLTEPTPLTLSLTGTNISCNGGTDGTVSTVSGGGTGAYTYTWSNAQTTANLTNVAAGTYDLTVSDANGCSITASTTLTEPTPLTLSLTGTNISCNGGTDGTVSTVSGGGTGAYTYTWSNAQTTANLTNVAAGTYDLTVSDANGCSITASTTLTEPTPLTLSLTGTNISCNGGTDGTVSTVSGGGTGAYTYTWSNAQTTANLTNVAAGTYDLTVSDANGCSITASTTLTEPTPLTLSLTGTNISCNGGTDGTVSTVSGGGTGAYTYTWSNAQTTANLTNVAAGTYDLTVSDANGCSITASTTLIEPTPLTLSLTGTNISCNGGTDGTVSTVSGGGTGAYTYTWSNAQTTANLTNVAAGTYDLTVSDANGCSITASTTLTEPTPLTLSLTGTNISCNGGTDGTVSTVSGGGTGAYTYTWSNAQTSANLTNVTAGTYDLTVSDANGCSITASTTLTEPTPLTLSLTGTNISCNGGTDGTVSTVSGGGTGAYTYTWSNAQTTANLTNVAAGTYDLTVSDANGCSITASTTLTEPTPLTLSLTGTNISCNGGTDGTVSTVSGGGTGAYTYTWSNAQTSANLTNVTAGTYDLTVSDANGCSITASTTLTEPTPLTLSLTGTNISCNGGTDGTVSTVSGGGTGAYTYTWSNAQTSANLTNVTAGTYDLTVSDANGCSITASTTLTEPTPLTLSLTGTNISCNGGTDGTVSTVSGGGTGAYTYTWSNAQTTANLTNVAAGTYDLTVSDANGCSITASTTLTEPTPLTLSLTGTNISCNGGTDGTVSTVSGGGTGAYTYTWSNAQTSANLTNVTAGTYDLTVSDANGCSITASTTLTEPTPLTLSLTGTNISCNGGTDGTVSTVSGGGTGAYTYTWSNAQTTANLTNVAAGTYDLTVSDANGCSITASTTLTEPTPLTLSLTGTNISCNGGTDGTVSTVSGGGTGAYTYTWSNAQTTANLTNVAAGTYDLTVSDANGCSITASTTLTEPTPLTLSLTGTNISCNGGTDGTVSTVSGGGTGAYTYTWSNAQTSANLTNVTAGTYDLTVSDANGCSITASTTLTEPTPLTLSLTGTNISCNGGTDGTVSTVSGGGTGAYTYTWSNAQTTANLTNVAAGTYDLTVSDANGCSITASTTLTEPTPLTLSLTGTNISCNGGTDGTVSTVSGGGTGAYTYTWSNAQTSANLTNVTAGTYDLTVSDANGCSITASTTLTEPTPLTLSLTGTNISCNGGTDGTVSTVSGGGTGAYTYTWSNAQTTANLTNVAAGTYDLTVSDANGCSITASTTLTEPTPLTLSLTGTNISCNGGTDGTVSTVSGGGTGAYTYTWSNAQTSANLTNVTAGTYDLTVSDANGCSITASTTLTEPTPLTLSLTGTNISCNGGTDGTVSTVSGGGTGAYTYTWSNAQTTANLTNVAAGTYDLTVSDANGCSITASTTLTEPTPLTLSLTGTNISCNGGTDGTVSTVSGGGTGAYTYTWSNAQTTANLTNVAAGTYDLTVSDANGCSITASTTLTEPTPLTLSLTGTNISCNGGTDGTVSTVSGGGTGAYTYTWSNAQTTANLTNVAAGTYDLTVSDANGCSITASTTLTEPTPLTLSLTGTNISCNGGTDGTVSTVSGGGTGAYTYTWSNAQTTANLTNVAAGTYDLTVSDANGCSITASTTLIEPTPLTLSLTGTNISCNGGTDGTVSTVSGGGTGAYTYTWSNAQTSANLTNVTAGTYDLTVSDANGCSITASTTLTEPTPLTLSLTGTNISCNGGTDGTVSTVSGGGTGAYTYTWSNAQTSANLTNVTAGTYDLTVSDANGCSITASTTLTEPTPLTLSLTGTNISCNGGTDGTVSTVSGGGTGAYTYTWSNAQTSANLTNVTAGTYDLTVSDANGCSITASTTLTEPTPLTLSLTGTNISCNGGTDGTVSTVSGGGTGAYTYTWSNAQTSANLTNVTAGTYDLTVSDANGCSITASTTLTEPTPLTLSLTGTNISCNGGTDGTVSTVSGGGTGAYTYTWSNAQTTANLTNVAAGTYDLTVSDANGCSITASTTLTEPTPLTLSLTGTNISCNGGTDGTVSTVSGGGTGAYTYTWSNAQTTANLTNVAAGTYDLTVSDANGCSITASTTLTEPTPLTLSLTGTNISCNGGTDGTVSTVSGGGTGAYTYTWSNAQTTANLTNVAAGTYDLTVSDANSCSITASTTLTEPTPLTLSLTGTNISCNGGTDGTVSTVSGGGTGAYTYTWSNAQTTANLTNVAAGTYDLTVSDANGCSITASTTLTEPTPLTLSLTGTNISCNGGTDGTVSTVSGGGTGAYTYTWSNAQTTANLTNVAAGTYDLTVSDANGCSITGSTTLTEPAGLSVTIATQPASCFGSTNGTASATTTGGTGNYTYTWDNGETGPNATALNAGNHQVSITDGNGCVQVEQFTITEPTQIVLTTSSTDALCYGAANGTATVSATGGTGAYTYQWSTTPTQTTPTIVGLAGGVTYLVTVTDANGCTQTASVPVGQPASPVTASIDGTYPTCSGSNDGTLTVSATGGTAPYFYAWSNGDTTAHIVDLATGAYGVTVTDANGCSYIATYTLRSPDAISAQVQVTDITCFGYDDGFIYIQNVTGGSGAYQYSLDGQNWQASTAFIRLKAGQYTVYIKDTKGCTFQQNVTVSEPSEFVIDAGQDVEIEYGDSTQIVTSSNFSGSINYVWTPNIYLSCDTCANPMATPLITTHYNVYATNENGCSAQDDILITVTKDRRLFVPTGFTPNGDNVNDVFMVHGNHYIKTVLILRVFDRWGNLVFEQSNFPPNNPTYGWDGTFKGQPLNGQVLAYYTEVLGIDDEVTIAKGNVTLIR